ncbi:MAG: hypothetical protein ACE5FZ_10145 [Nitrospiria bacterium]
MESLALTDPLLQEFPRSLISDVEGGLFLFYGDPSLFALSPLLAGWRLELGERVLFLDGGNCFDPYPLVAWAKRMGRNPQSFLSALFISRAFTCHQMGSLIFNQLKTGIAAHRPRLVILASPLETFYDESVPFIEAKNLLLHLLTALGQMARDRIFVVLSPFPRKMAGRRAFFLSHIKHRADKIFRIDRPAGSLQRAIRITEEKPSSRRWVLPVLGQ